MDFHSEQLQLNGIFFFN